MNDWKVPVQSLIDHIKTAVDVDPWAKEMAEELLTDLEPKQVKTDMYGNAYCPWCSTDRTIEMGTCRLHIGTHFCPYCGKQVKWDD